MIRWFVGAVVLVAVVLAAFLEGQRRAHNEDAARIEHIQREALQKQREAETRASAKGQQEIARWKREAAAQQAEVKRLRSAASVAAKEVKAVERAGAELVERGTVDEILAALRARGYRPERCAQVVR